MKVKIVSDGTSTGTKVYDAESGAELSNILKLDFNTVADNKSTVDITFRLPVNSYTIELPITLNVNTR